MANPEHIALLRKGVAEWNAWREQNSSLQAPDLRDAEGAELELPGANLRGALLSGASLPGANLYSADLRGADIRRANLSGTDLRKADLRLVNLEEPFRSAFSSFGDFVAAYDNENETSGMGGLRRTVRA